MKQYGLIGYPLGHSFSQIYFTEKFSRENIDARYDLFPLEKIEDVVPLINNTLNLCGFNVTIPYKQAIMPYLDELDDEAKQVGAVNVVKITNKNGRPHLKGFNSDIYGFYESLKPLLGPQHKSALILGTGGASKAVAAMLKKLNIDYKFVSRTPKPDQLTYTDLNEEIIRKYTLIVNSSPVGMSPNIDACPDIPYEFIGKEHLLFDLIYNPEETKFLNEGKSRGAKTKNGLEMLHLQAEGAWKYWSE